MAETTDVKCTVYVNGLAPEVTSDVLRDSFIPFGEIVSISLPGPDAPNSTEIHRGFAYIEFQEQSDAADAIDNMHESEIFGRTVRVLPAKPQKEQNEGLDSKVAVWEQESWIKENVLNKEAEAEVDASLQETESGLVDKDVAGPREQ